MNFSTLARRGLVGAAAAAAVLAGTVTPAQANDHSMVLRNAAGDVVVRASWDDSHDNLCITVWGGSRAWGQVAIESSHGLSEPERATRSASNGGTGQRYCTGNLSIREDALYDMQVRWESAAGNWRYSPRTQFHT